MFDQRLLAFPRRSPRSSSGTRRRADVPLDKHRRATRSGSNRESADYYRGPAVRRHPYRGRPHPTGRYRTARDAVLT